MVNAFVFAEGLFRELETREKTLLKHLGRSGSDPAFAETRELAEEQNSGVKQNSLQGSWMLQREGCCSTSTSGSDQRQEILHYDALLSSFLWQHSVD